MNRRTPWGCDVWVPCPRFDGGWVGEPLGWVDEPDPPARHEGWTREVTRAWREHPILKEGT